MYTHMHLQFMHTTLYAPQNAVLLAESVSVDEEQDSYVFPEAGELDGLAVSSGSSASVSIPRELLMGRAEGQH